MNHDFHLSTGYFEHPKIQKLERRFQEAGVLSHIKLLRFTAQSHPDGRLVGMDDEDIALAAGWRHDPSEFVATLVALRLLDGGPGAYSVHDWLEHNLWASEAPRRKEAARIAAQARWAKERAKKLPRGVVAQSDDHAAAMRVASSGNAYNENYKQDSLDPNDQQEQQAQSLAAIVDFPRAEEVPSRRRSVARKKGRDDYSPDVVKLVDLLASQIERFCGEAPRVLPDWYVEMDRLVRLDGRSPDDVRATIEFAFSTDFWPPNVLKPAKLRRHWEAMRAQMARGQRAAKPIAGSREYARPERTSLEEHHQNGLAFLSLYGENP